jgi:hypothetical protein
MELKRAVEQVNRLRLCEVALLGLRQSVEEMLHICPDLLEMAQRQ